MGSAFRGQPGRGQRPRDQQDALEVLARWECQGHPGEAGKSVQKAGEPVPASQVSMLCPGAALPRELSSPWPRLGVSEQDCEVEKVMVVTVREKTAQSAHAWEAAGEVCCTLLIYSQRRGGFGRWFPHNPAAAGSGPHGVRDACCGRPAPTRLPGAIIIFLNYVLTPPLILSL